MNFINIPALWRPNGIKKVQSPIRSFNSLNSVLDSFGPFPKYSVVLGSCTDSLPFILDLGHPRSGSVLVAGYNRQELTKLLRTIVLSACRINDPHKVSFVLITKNPEDYMDITGYPHCQGLLSPYDRNTGETVIELASVSEQRRSGRELGGAIMLLIDGLENFSSVLSDYSVYLNLKSLITNGPRSMVWPIITISANPANTVDGQFLNFGTYMMQYPKNNNKFAVEIHGNCFDINNLST